MKFKCFLFSFLTAFTLVSCGKKSVNSSSHTPSIAQSIPQEDGHGHTVMIIDTGIDPKGYEKQIVGHYDLNCAFATFYPAIRSYESLLTEITTKPPYSNYMYTFPSTPEKALQQDDERREIALKKAISWMDEDERQQLTCSVRELEKGDRSFVLDENGNVNEGHGTDVLNTLARNVSNLKLVLLQVKLDSERFPHVPDRSSGFSTSGLVEKTLIEEFNNPKSELFKRYLTLPSKALTLSFDLMRKHKVDYVNMSYMMYEEENLNDAGFLKCPVAKFMKKEEREMKIETWKMKKASNPMQWKFPENVKLAVFAAGNCHEQIDSMTENIFCDQDETRIIHIGSYNSQRKMSSFSSFGKCVKAYALGEEVKVVNSRGIEKNINGTSFASPNFIRFLVTHTDPSFTHEEVNSFYQSHLDESLFLEP